MWVLFKKTYSGPLGLFLGGIKQDIPKETAEKLGKFCSPVPAPWDKPESDSSQQKEFRTPMDKQYRPRQKNPYRTK
jgi:hypothetical protein